MCIRAVYLLYYIAINSIIVLTLQYQYLDVCASTPYFLFIDPLKKKKLMQ